MIQVATLAKRKMELAVDEQRFQTIMHPATSNNGNARLPDEMNDVLMSRTEPGLIFHGYVNIRWMRFYFIAVGFEYDVKEKMVGLPPFDDLATTIYTCRIDKSSYKQLIRSIGVQEYYNGCEQIILDGILDELGGTVRGWMESNHADENQGAARQ